MDMKNWIEVIARSSGIGYVGVGDLSIAASAHVEVDIGLVREYPYCITLGIPLMKDIVDQLPNRRQRAAALNYRLHAYDVINQRLDLAASVISSHIQQEGYRALPIPAAERVDDRTISASFSHKLGARLAGFGWIGKSCLLVTQAHGPRVRWTSILTDAPLAPAGDPIEEQCGGCIECVDICPVNAFKNRNFNADEPREARFDALKCQQYYDGMKDEGLVPVCGMCLYICPYGRK